MQPYEPIDWVAELEADHAARIAREAITDEDLREQGYKEPYPGYFVDDPRHQGYDVHDRYLMDHPGPDWRTKPKFVRGVDDRIPTHDGKMLPYPRAKILQPAQDGLPPVRSETWDDELLQGTTTPVRQYGVLSSPGTSYYPSPDGKAIFEITDLSRSKYSAAWLCKVCSKKPALYPIERYWQVRPFGLVITIVFRSPLACTECRIFRQPEVAPLDEIGRRPFWRRAVALWERDWPEWFRAKSRQWRWKIQRWVRQAS